MVGSTAPSVRSAASSAVGHQVGQHGGDQDRAVRPRAQGADLGVGAEPAGGGLHAGEEVAHERQRPVEGAGLGHDQAGAGAPQVPVMGGDHVRTRSR